MYKKSLTLDFSMTPGGHICRSNKPPSLLNLTVLIILNNFNPVIKYTIHKVNTKIERTMWRDYQNQVFFYQKFFYLIHTFKMEIQMKLQLHLSVTGKIFPNKCLRRFGQANLMLSNQLTKQFNRIKAMYLHFTVTISHTNLKRCQKLAEMISQATFYFNQLKYLKLQHIFQQLKLRK